MPCQSDGYPFGGAQNRLSGPCRSLTSLVDTTSRLTAFLNANTIASAADGRSLDARRLKRETPAHVLEA